MEEVVGPRLLEAFLASRLKYLDNPTKAALRLCSKRFKALVDATVSIACWVEPDDLYELVQCNWNNLERLVIVQKGGKESSAPSSRAIRALLCAAVSRFPLLTYLALLKCTTLAALPENIGDLSHLIKIWVRLPALKAPPPSFGQLTTLEFLEIVDCDALTLEGLAPLKHLKQLKCLTIDEGPATDPLFPEWLCGNGAAAGI